MNKLISYNKFDDYRLPLETEFVKGFEYEYLNLVITKPYITYNNGKSLQLFWNKAKVGSAWDLSKEQVSQMLKTGGIRVPLRDTKILMKVNEKIHNIQTGLYITTYNNYLLNSKYNVEYISVYPKSYANMSLYYYSLNKCDIIYNSLGNIDVSKSLSCSISPASPRFIIVEANNAKEGHDKILEHFLKIDISNKHELNDSIKDLHRILEINGVLGYRINSGGTKILIPEFNYESTRLDSPYDYVTDEADVIILGTEVQQNIIKSVLRDKNTFRKYEQLKVSNISNNNAGIMKAGNIKKVLDKLTPRLSFMSNIRVRCKDKANKDNIIPTNTQSRYVDGVWKPVKHNRVAQQPILSEDRLVFIASKDKTYCTRVKYVEAEKILSENKELEFIQKKEGKDLVKKLTRDRLRIGNSIPTSFKAPRINNKRRNVKTKIIGDKLIKYQEHINPTYTPQPSKKEKVIKPNYKTIIPLVEQLKEEDYIKIRVITPEGKVSTKDIKEITRYKIVYPKLAKSTKTKKWKCPIKRK